MVSPTQQDPTSPRAVAAATFSTARRGYQPSEVTAFLRSVATEMARLRERISQLQTQLARAKKKAATQPEELDEAAMIRLLGEETSRVLTTARTSATEIKARAEAVAAKVLRDAHDEGNNIRNEADIDAARIREQAHADGRVTIERAREEARAMAIEVREYRERVLADLNRRTALAKEQIGELLDGRDRLLQVFERARLVAIDVTSGVKDLDLPTEYVNLAPTTGPVPVMVKAPESELPADQVDPVAAVPPILPPTPEPEPQAQYDAEPDVEPEQPVDQFDDHADVDADADAELAADDPAADEAVDLDIAVLDTFVSEDDSTEHTNVVPFQRRGASADRFDDASDDDVFDDDDELINSDDNYEVDEVEVNEVTDVEVDEVTDVDAIEYDQADDESLAEDELDQAPAAADDTDETDDGTNDQSNDDPDDPDDPDDLVGGLFARLREIDTIESDAAESDAAESDTAESETAEPDVAESDIAESDIAESDIAESDTAEPAETVEDPFDAGAVFEIRAKTAVEVADSAARKLKRVLADEQNEVLQVLRTGAADTVDDLLPPAQLHAAAYLDAITDEINSTATAAATAFGADSTPDVIDAVRSRLVIDLIDPLRHKLDRAVRDNGGHNDAIAKSVRSVYREWKRQHIDTELAELLRVAFATATSASIPAGVPVVWTPDPDAVACAECEDNSLAGAIPNGHPFPTGHVAAPAHGGCRCLPIPG